MILQILLLLLSLLSLPTTTRAAEISVIDVLDHPKFVAVNGTGRPTDNGRYIVVMDQELVSSDNVNQTVEDVLSNVDGMRLGRVFRHALMAFSVEVDDDSGSERIASPRDQRAQRLLPLLELDLVRFIEEEQVITSYNNATNADQNFPPSWGLDRLDQSSNELDRNYHYDQTGVGVTAYILDTGIRTTHDDFGGRVVCGYNAFDGESCEDGNGHGTHVAGTVGGARFGVAKEVAFVTVKVLNNSGEGSTMSVLEGIDYVAEQGQTKAGPKVANLSLGGFRSPAINLAVGQGNFGNVFFVVAAGNENRNACLGSPASSDLVTTVGATDRNDARAGFSNFGTCLDVFAPGVDIVSAWHTGNSDYNTISGTSMASPHVAGVAALYLEVEPNLTNSPLILRRRLVDDALTGIVVDARGSPNALVTTGSLFTTAAAPPPPDAEDPNPLEGPSKITSDATTSLYSWAVAAFCLIFFSLASY